MYPLRTIFIGIILLILTLGQSFSQERKIIDSASAESMNKYSQEADSQDIDLLQTDSKNEQSQDLSLLVSLASTSPDYPVTPGDTYLLNIFSSIISDSVVLRVESNGYVEISTLGRINANGLTFPEFTQQVKNLVNASYKDATTQVSILSVGSFQVLIKGEVKGARLVNVWGLSRLSTIVGANKTPYTSLRDIKVIDNSGLQLNYDLFKAFRLGDLDQDPYIQPGDQIILSKYERQITLEGEFRRPGTYQLLPGETLEDVIAFYGDGLTPYSDTEIQITSWDRERSIPQFKSYLDLNTIDPSEIEIKDLDLIKTSSKKDMNKIVSFEGAVNGDSTSIIKYQISDGEYLSSAVNYLKNDFPLDADLENTYIERIGEPDRISIDLVDLLYNNNETIDIKLNHNDRIIIPFRQYFVNVSGEVENPGRYPYIPNRSWNYYVNMAGGFDNSSHFGEKLVILDYNNNKKSKDMSIEPEDTIIVPSNDFIYNVNRYSTFVSIVTSIISSIVTINLLLN